MASTHRLALLCGASGVGKRWLLDKLCEELPERFGAGISNTTRPPKEHEVDGSHYWFKDKPGFAADIEAGRCRLTLSNPR